MSTDVELVITPCGMTKAPTRARADRLYTGRYFLACLRYAHTLVSPERIRILSAKHGFLQLHELVDPYDLKFGMPGAVDLVTLRLQATGRGLLGRDPVVILGGRAYATPCLQLWPHASTPLIGLPGRMGGQMAALDAWVRQARAERTPAP